MSYRYAFDKATAKELRLTTVEKARLVENILNEVRQQDFPIAWERLSRIKIEGEISYTASLSFRGTRTGIVLTSIWLSDTLEVLQWGTNYGDLVY